MARKTLVTTTTDFGRQALEFLDFAYSGGEAAENLDIVAPFFEHLRKVVDFSTAVFFGIDPSTWLLEEGHAHDMDPPLMLQYLQHYKHLDPFLHYMPCLRRPNEVVRFSDIADVGRIAQGEFGEFMGRVPYFHALALAPVIRGVPLGVFSIQRRAREHDFDGDEQELFRRFMRHVATAIDYRRLVARFDRASAVAALAVSRDGRILSATDEARAILRSLPENKVFSLPSTAERPRIWFAGAQTHVVRSVAPPRDSLLDRLDGADVSYCADLDALQGRISVGSSESRPRFVVIIEPLDVRRQSHGKLVGYGFTQRQEQVAVLLILGRRPKEIAGLCGISPNTVCEHIEDVYRKLGVHSREQFLRAVLGPAPAAVPA